MNPCIALIVKYVPATNTKGSRVSLHFPRLDKRKLIPFNSMRNSTSAVALDYLEEYRIYPVAEAEGKKGEDIFFIDYAEISKILAL
jgi:hypothetical protein